MLDSREYSFDKALVRMWCQLYFAFYNPVLQILKSRQLISRNLLIQLLQARCRWRRLSRAEFERQKGTWPAPFGGSRDLNVAELERLEHLDWSIWTGASEDEVVERSKSQSSVARTRNWPRTTLHLSHRRPETAPCRICTRGSLEQGVFVN